MTVHLMHPEMEPKKQKNEGWTTEAPPERDRKLNPAHVTDTVPRDFRQVPGWGVDLDPRNRPMVPMELPSDVKTVRGEVRDWQKPTSTIFTSIEQPNRTPVFGTSCPPKGLSGLLRSYAYRYGEGATRHWMMLILADRVDILESMATEALRGNPDNIFREKGWKANVKHRQVDRRQVFSALGFAGALVAGALLVSALRRD